MTPVAIALLLLLLSQLGMVLIYFLLARRLEHFGQRLNAEHRYQRTARAQLFQAVLDRVDQRIMQRIDAAVALAFEAHDTGILMPRAIASSVTPDQLRARMAAVAPLHPPLPTASAPVAPITPITSHPRWDAAATVAPRDPSHDPPSWGHDPRNPDAEIPTEGMLAVRPMPPSRPLAEQLRDVVTQPPIPGGVSGMVETFSTSSASTPRARKPRSKREGSS